MSNILEKEDIDLFYKLYSRLLCFVNKEAKIFQSKMLHPNDFEILSLEDRMKIREVLYNKKEYFDQFLNNNDALELNTHEFAMINEWKHFIRGNFFIYKHYKEHSIFIDDSDSPKAYGVSGIFDPLKEMFPFPPVFIRTILIPFKNKIIYDGLIEGYSISFGSNFQYNLKSSYEKIKKKKEIILQLPKNNKYSC